MRGRPKVLLARSYEEAEQLCHVYSRNLLGIITDISFNCNGQKDVTAGVALSRALLSNDAHLPIIMQSSDHANKCFANELGLSFVQKHAKTYTTDLHNQHLEQNNISRFLYSRAIFPPAEVLRQHDVTQYNNMHEARVYISQLIDRYRTMKHAGVVAVFHKEDYDNYNNFTRIGKGSLGGKGRGLAFMNSFIKQYLLQHDKESAIRVDIRRI